VGSRNREQIAIGGWGFAGFGRHVPRHGLAQFIGLAG